MADSKVITQNDIKNILAHINLGDDAHKEITQAEFNALPQAERDDGTIYFITDGVSGNTFLEDNVPIGTITPYGGDSDPDYWLICDGRAISRTTYADLFAVIGTTYGTGDGSTTFNIPDLSGKVAIGSGTNYSLGSTGGKSELTLSAAVGAADSRANGIAYLGENRSEYQSAHIYSYNLQASSYNTSSSSSYWNHSTPVTEATGTDRNVTNMQPYIVTNYIIKAYSTVSEHQATVDFFHPVGSYYETSDTSFDPNVSWGGTWISEAAVSNEIVIGTPTITGANSGVYCNLSRLGRTVRFQFGVNFNLNLAASTITTVGSVPIGFRPASEVVVGGYILGGTYGFAYIEPNGEIRLQRAAAGTGNLIRQNFVYFTSDDISVGLRWHRTA